MNEKLKLKYSQLVNTKFAKLTIKKLIYDETETVDKRYKYLCDCDCGTKDKLIPCRNITYHKYKSCGCLTGGTVTGEANPNTVTKYNQLVNTKVGKLLIKSIVVDNTKYKYYYLCDCDCGVKDKKIPCFAVYNNKQQSCGCLQGNRSTVINHNANIGYKFGMLQVLAVKYLNHEFYYECKCDCGNIGLYRPRYLRTGNITSCGCKQLSDAINKYKTYVGKRCGLLTITNYNYYPENKKNKTHHMFTCKCDCGNVIDVPVHLMVNNNGKTTCGNCFNSVTSHAGYLKLLEYCKENNLELLSDYSSKSVSVINNNGNISTTYNKYLFKCLKCNNTFHKTLHPYYSLLVCPYCNKTSISGAEYLIRNFLASYNINFDKSLIESMSSDQNRIEIDFNIPDHNLGIELHGLEVHSTHEYIYSHFNSKSKRYHLNKLESAAIRDIDLLQFWNTEVYQKTDIVKSIILNRLNLTPYSTYARNCYISKIDKHTSDSFLNTHHIQGTVTNDSVRLGLFHKSTNNLVAVMTFGSSRFSNHDWELYRFATYINCRIVGAASKLFKCFIRNYNPVSIVSYSDRRLFNSGKLYDILGFKLDHISAPNYWYFKKGVNDKVAKLYHRVQFQKHKLSKLLESFDPNKTEYQNMEENGYLRIYDCGNKVYIYRKK
jgi:hypothetical protein